MNILLWRDFMLETVSQLSTTPAACRQLPCYGCSGCAPCPIFRFARINVQTVALPWLAAPSANPSWRMHCACVVLFWRAVVLPLPPSPCWSFFCTFLADENTDVSCHSPPHSTCLPGAAPFHPLTNPLQLVTVKEPHHWGAVWT